MPCLGHTPGGGGKGEATPRAQKEEPGWEQLKGRKELGQDARELRRGGQLTEMQTSQEEALRWSRGLGQWPLMNGQRIWGLRLSSGSVCDRLPFPSFSFLR